MHVIFARITVSDPIDGNSYVRLCCGRSAYTLLGSVIADASRLSVQATPVVVSN